MDNGLIYKTAVLTVSDRCFRRQAEDKSGPLLREMVAGLPAEVVGYDIVPDEAEEIKKRLIGYCDEIKAHLVLTTGGTGFGPRDVTPEATLAVVERQAPGLAEAMRRECFRESPRAMLSRGVCGLRGETLIVNLPGSARGARQCLEVILPHLPHGLEMARGEGHNDNRI
ncbi:MAG: molybdenum cofactor biosynthesis protein B [Candidatus Omnitrophota bacterium]